MRPALPALALRLLLDLLFPQAAAGLAAEAPLVSGSHIGLRGVRPPIQVRPHGALQADRLQEVHRQALHGVLEGDLASPDRRGPRQEELVVQQREVLVGAVWGRQQEAVSCQALLALLFRELPERLLHGPGLEAEPDDIRVDGIAVVGSLRRPRMDLQRPQRLDDVGAQAPQRKRLLVGVRRPVALLAPRQRRLPCSGDRQAPLAASGYGRECAWIGRLGAAGG